MALDPSIDIDAETGANIEGWAHVLQSLEEIFTTSFGERAMREWFGSMVPAFLGENMNTTTIVAFFSAVASAIDQWEPRYKITQIAPLSVGRDGRFEAEIQGHYRPRALLGDLTQEGARRVSILGGQEGLRLAA
jgi:phage baseplate assembly protein W